MQKNNVDGEACAIEILTWMSGQDDLFTRFLAITGITANEIRTAAAEPGFFAGVTSFLMNHEPTLLAFCQDTNTKPETVIQAHNTLSGDTSFDGWN